MNLKLFPCTKPVWNCSRARNLCDLSFRVTSWTKPVWTKYLPFVTKWRHFYIVDGPTCRIFLWRQQWRHKRNLCELVSIFQVSITSKNVILRDKWKVGCGFLGEQAWSSTSSEARNLKVEMQKGNLKYYCNIFLFLFSCKSKIYKKNWQK